MKKIALVIDGMLSGTGIRDFTNGGYIEAKQLGLSEPLRDRLTLWIKDYADAHFFEYQDKDKVNQLDERGMKLAQCVGAELPYADVRYYSNAHMRYLSC